MSDELRFWNMPVEYLKGVGPKRGEFLRNECGIFTAGDLLMYFPYRHIDRSKIDLVATIRDDQPYVQLRGRLSNVRVIERGPHRRLSATLTDATGSVELTWFQGIRFFKKSLTEGAEYLIFGKPVRLGKMYSVAHPELERTTLGSEPQRLGLIPLYSSTEKMKKSGLDSRNLENLIRQAVDSIFFQFSETLCDHIIAQYGLCSRHQAILGVHFPPSLQALEKSLYRLKFEELFYLRLKLLRLNWSRKIEKSGLEIPRTNNLVKEFYQKHLPFPLTDAQIKVLREIREDLSSGRQMSRLLQGDVGSGKTIVALITMLSVIDAGYQACLMAPTEILAQQHYFSISDFLKALRIPVGLLTGSTSRAARQEILTALAEGNLPLVLGTHALIEDDVQFKNLALAVIDEQHRFGVAQRGKMWQKNTVPPHILIMTATPIPRTLALTVYGDLDVSILDQMPPGRKPVLTSLLFQSQYSDLKRYVEGEIKNGRQVFWVFPIIEDSEKLNYTSLVEGYEKIKRDFLIWNPVMLHGRMAAGEKENAMIQFISGVSKILVSTTVIEVGVNVPNASVMVIEHAERFGLAQLHQLRGRVGRGAEQSFCFLVASNKLSREGQERLQVMVSTNDGFKIAEADLIQRGAGDFEGTQQSGMIRLKIANLATDQHILSDADAAARWLLNTDPYILKTENEMIKNHLRNLDKSGGFWRNIA